MISWHALLWLFLAERPHQWLSLLRPGAGTERDARAPRRFLGLCLAVFVLEALALYVTEPRVLWAVVFWTQALHVAQRAASGAARYGRRYSILAAVAAAATAVGCGLAGGPDVWSWFGAPGCGQGAPGATLGPTALLVFWVVAHAWPETAAQLRGIGVSRAAGSATLALALTYVEWRLVASTIGFPGVLLFPDLANVVNLGREEGLWIVPFWTAPFFAHVALDARRSWRARLLRA